jgi:hypothetical protein
LDKFEDLIAKHKDEFKEFDTSSLENKHSLSSLNLEKIAKPRLTVIEEACTVSSRESKLRK